MKVVTFSDLHGKQNSNLTEWFDKNPADLLIFAGDLQFNQTDDFGDGFMKWFHRLSYPLKIMVFGNHDGHYKRVLKYKEDNNLDDIMILTDTVMTINTPVCNVKIYGSPHSVQFGRWWFMMKDNELGELWKQIPEDVDILITHGPPYGIMDYTFSGEHAGSMSLLERIEQLPKLKYHIFGHIHEGHGIKVIGDTTFMNVSILNERYQLVHKPIIFDYDTGITEIDYNVGE